MKILRLFRQKKLRAATARRASAASAGMDFGDIPEPNMKLSRALLIVLLLHVVAVSGIIAFNAIKTRESSFSPTVPANTENKIADAPGTAIRAEAAKPRDAVAGKESAPRDDANLSHSPPKDEHAKAPSFAKPTARKPPSSGKTYIVKKGDNPVTIARRLKVSYDDLIALNHIEDPHKLQIGQKLLVPTTDLKTTETKKNKK
jgi:LysM repeat protein